MIKKLISALLPSNEKLARKSAQEIQSTVNDATEGKELVVGRYATFAAELSEMSNTLAQIMKDGKVDEMETDTLAKLIEPLIGKAREVIGLCLTVAVCAFALTGCVYKGGKVIDGTNFAIGITVPGTEWTVNALDYVGGLRVAGQDSTHIVVTNEVAETNSFFGCVSTIRHTKMTADIEPLAKEETAQ